MKKLMIILISVCSSFSLKAQILHPVKWSYGAKKISKTQAVLLLKADIEDGWHIYSAYQKEGGPVPTSITFSTSKDFELTGKLTEPKSITRNEPAFKMDVNYFEHEVIFQQKITLRQAQGDSQGAVVFVLGSLKFMVCNDHQCLPPETINFNIPVK